MKSLKIRHDAAGHRWSIASRVLAATVGGYVFTAVSSAALAQCLPLIAGVSRAQGVLIATLLSFVTYTVVALAVFCSRSASRSWAWLVIAGLSAALMLTAVRSAP